MATILVSACLLGLATRYDGRSFPCQEVIDLIKDHDLIPVCPEQAGGLPTPRTPSERVGDKVLMRDGTDVTEQYNKGASSALYLAELYHADLAILKSSSPSCGVGTIYDGSFTGNKCNGNGITADLLISKGIPVYTENDIDEIKAFISQVSS